VGIVNDGIESLKLFKDIYDPVIEAWHGYKPNQKHQSNMNSKDIKSFTVDQKIVDKYVLSTRVRAGRSILNLSLPAFTDKADRAKVEELLKKGFDSLADDLKGK